MTIIAITKSSTFSRAVDKLINPQEYNLLICETGKAALTSILDLHPDNVALILIDEQTIPDFTIQEFRFLADIRFNVRTPRCIACLEKDEELFSTQTERNNQSIGELISHEGTEQQWIQ